MLRQWFSAARTGNDQRVAKFLAERPNLSAEIAMEDGNTALHYAAEHGHETIVARLLAARPVSIRERNICGCTALDMAASRDHEKVVAQILDFAALGLDISGSHQSRQRGNNGNLTPQNPNFTVSSGLALISMINKGDQMKFTQLLALCPSLSDAVIGLGISTLHHAARQGRDEMVSQILALRPRMINAVDMFGRNVLMYAVVGASQTVAETLLAIKPELISHVSSPHGDTVLHIATRGTEQDPEFVGKLWRMNPQALTHLNAYSKTPFHQVVESTTDALIKLFQWSLSFDEIVSAFKDCRVDWHERYRPVMEQLCESLFVNLNRDVAGTALEYVGIDVVKRANKRAEGFIGGREKHAPRCIKKNTRRRAHNKRAKLS